MDLKDRRSFTEFPLTQGKATIVDSDEVQRLYICPWWATKRRDKWYAQGRPNGEYSPVMMHRFILGLSSSDTDTVDHVNGNGLDNRKSNLRLASFSLQNHNKSKKPNTSSSFRGVTWYSRYRKWSARFRGNFLGYFDAEENAAKTYDKAAREYYGEFARTNF